MEQGQNIYEVYKVLDQLTRNLEAVDADPAEAFEPLEIQ